MQLYVLSIIASLISSGLTINLNYLDPVKLQTKLSPAIQQDTALNIISQYLNNVEVEVNPIMFSNHKDVFSLRTTNGQLHIRASTGVAAVWGFNYYLKKYCKCQIAWQVQRVVIPSPLPDVDEVVIANDRFRYYQNVCTASYSFVWWKTDDWRSHVEWMALNGINLALAPVAQEAAWARIYRQLGMSEDDIKEHFTGPAFLAWLRMGNVHRWGGPLPQSWHDQQRDIQDKIVGLMFKLGMIPVFPAFNGHVPRAFKNIFPNMTLYNVTTWNRFDSEYCCNLFIDPKEPAFKTIGKMFLKEITAGTSTGNIYTVDPFNEVEVQPWSTSLVQETAKSIFSTISEMDKDAVWLLQNWMFVYNTMLWPLKRVKIFLTSVPNGRMLILDLQSEQSPQFDLYEMYYGQPFIWCMLHNFGGTLGMFGNMQTINEDVYKTRNRVYSTMLGIGLTPEGINQNYVVYDLMLESAWRLGPVEDLNKWVEDYAERRYGCNATATAWKYLLKSVYNFSGLNRMRGKYVVTRRPSFRIRPWAWYKSSDLFDALKGLIFSESCDSSGFIHDVVDVTRQALQYRIDQLYVNLSRDRFSNTIIFNYTITRFLDAMTDMENILATNDDFKVGQWVDSAKRMAPTTIDSYFYELNSRNQITLWGPKGEITDYACKQWAELIHYYYKPRWATFLEIALDAKMRNEIFDEKNAQAVVRYTVEEKFLTTTLDSLPADNTISLASNLYQKWAFVSNLDDLPCTLIKKNPERRTTLADTDIDGDDIIENNPSIVMLHPTKPAN
ncbi:LOW QUALITY PROTEIN: alpha-N-acetylglucosaminidase [Melitaea cinxia]|uniref:LOW QUALITY PROTEIN: alpha-N-acetylglucosaminidase n=1 Tax=Melitaea cinxia TaxID=113334 RepID=UPI001E26E9E3|nr:LOW QUALITY PROTEIN: alpha-N-acetylglucosaminidase [Melitaea cinxia]